MSASRGADGLSGQIRVRTAEYVHVYTASYAHYRREPWTGARRRTHAHQPRSSTNPRQPGNFCCATERPSRNLAYARLATSHGRASRSWYPSPVSRAVTRTTQQRARWHDSPARLYAFSTNARANQRTPTLLPRLLACLPGSLARSLARSRALVQPYEPPCHR